MASIWPTAVATDANLYLAVNELQTNLSSGINNSVTTITLNSTTSFPTVGLVLIDNEVIKYTGISGSNLTGCTRAFDGTTAASHSAAAIVSFAIMAAHHNVLKDEIEAIEASLRDLVGLSPTLPLTVSLPVQTDSSGHLTAAAISLSGSGVTGTLTIAKGGTNSVAALNNNRVMKSASGAIVEAAAIAGNLALTSDSNGIPVGSPAGVTDTQLGYLLNLFAYRRPVLQYVGVSTVDVEAGIVTGVSGDVTILFPDGKLVTVNSSTQTRFDITRNCALSGTKQSGLRASLSESVNMWYALYAVRATDNDNTWVTVGDTVLPLRANFATLNSNFGTGKWVFLGMIRNGDHSAATGDIIKFIQNGNMTLFRNACSNAGTVTARGMIMASATGASSVSYTYAAGTSGQVIPDQCTTVLWGGAVNVGSTGSVEMENQADTFRYFFLTNQVSTCFSSFWGAAAEGVKVGGPASSNEGIFLSGFIDTALGIGTNPLL